MNGDAWEQFDEVAASTSPDGRQGMIAVALVIVVAIVGWASSSPATRVPDDAELAVDTEEPPDAGIDRVTFLGNGMEVDERGPARDRQYVSVQWGGGSIAVPYAPGAPAANEVYYVCDGTPVRVVADQADLPPVAVIAGAGIHSRLLGCTPQVPDIPLDTTGLASWSLPILVRLNNDGLSADLSPALGGTIDVVLRGVDDDPLSLTLRPSFGPEGRPPVGSEYAAFAGGEVLQFADTQFLTCDRGSMIEVTGQTVRLATYLHRIDCVPTAPPRPRDPMDSLHAATEQLATAVGAGGLRVFDISVHRPVVRFSVAGPAGEVRMLAMNDVTVERAGDRAVPVGDGEVLRRRDGGTVTSCNGLILAIDPEYEPIAIPTLRAMADAGACSLARPAPSAL